MRTLVLKVVEVGQVPEGRHAPLVSAHLHAHGGEVRSG